MKTPSRQTTDTILKAIEKKQLTATVLPDMSKALESVDHETLMSKLQDIGLLPIAIEFLRSYLKLRYQVVH